MPAVVIEFCRQQRLPGNTALNVGASPACGRRVCLPVDRTCACVQIAARGLDRLDLHLAEFHGARAVLKGDPSAGNLAPSAPASGSGKTNVSAGQRGPRCRAGEGGRLPRPEPNARRGRSRFRDRRCRTEFNATIIGSRTRCREPPLGNVRAAHHRGSRLTHRNTRRPQRPPPVLALERKGVEHQAERE